MNRLLRLLPYAGFLVFWGGLYLLARTFGWVRPDVGITDADFYLPALKFLLIFNVVGCAGYYLWYRAVRRARGGE